MFLDSYPERDGMKVWLEQDELDRFIDEAENTEQRIAFQLLGYSGLRSAETLQVTPNDVVHTSAGPRVRVWNGKGGKDRETIASDDLASVTSFYTDVGNRDPDTPMVSTEHPRTLRKWVKRAGGRLADREGEEGWTFLSPHDLRGTWATLMVHDYEVSPMLVMDWGGWEHLETFLEHYRGIYSVPVQRRELTDVPWIDAHSPETSSETEQPNELGRIRAE